MRSSTALALTPSSQNAVATLVLDHLGEGEREVVRRDRRAVAPRGVGRSVKRYDRPSSETVNRSARSGSISKSRPIATSPRKRLRVTCVAGSESAVARCHRCDPRPPAAAQVIRSVGSSRAGAGAAPRERLAERLVRGAVVEGEVVGQPDLEQRLASARLVPGSLHEAERAPVELDRLVLRVDRPGRVARLEQVLDRALGLVRLGEVVGEQPVHLRGRIAVELHERLADPQVELAPAGLDERPVGDLLHESVAEPVLGRGSAPLLDHELEPLELGERRPQPRPREAAARAAEGRRSGRSRRRS